MVLDLMMKMRGLTSVLDALESLRDEWLLDDTYYVTAEADYAKYVEYGTYKMQAQPYMRPAARRVRQNMDVHLQTGAVRSGDTAVAAVAEAVESEAKRIVPVDTGNLKNSIKTYKE